MVGPRGHQPSELFAAGRSQLPVLWAMALPFHGQECAVANRVDYATPGQPHLQPSGTPRAALLLPGKDEARHAAHIHAEEHGGLFLLQDLVDD